jgi:hypothetical protein
MATPMYLMYDGARVSTESALGKELLKWERRPDWTPEGNPFPKMLYRAQHRPDGRRSVGEVLDSVSGGYPGAAEQFSRRCQLTVNDEAEMIRAKQQGWRETQQEALEALEERDNAVSTATAERHASDRRMSEKAQREAAEADASTAKHVPEVTGAVLREAREKKRRKAG